MTAELGDNVLGSIRLSIHLSVRRSVRLSVSQHCQPFDLGLPRVAKSNKDHYQSKVLFCVSVIRARPVIIHATTVIVNSMILDL